MSAQSRNENEYELIEEIAGTYGTPLYVYLEDEISDRIEKVGRVFEGINLLPTFACKANNNPNIIRLFSKEGFGTDIVSIGEYHASKLAFVEDQDIVWNGNGKTNQEMEFLDSRVGYINIDSAQEYERWKFHKHDATFFLRINPDVDPLTHHHISTGLKKNKFGVPVEEIDTILKDHSGPKISGFHVHIGSQIVDVGPFEEAISMAVELSKKYGFSKIDIGGGWGIRYQDKELDIEEYRQRIIPLLKDFELVIFELGRYLVAPAGLLVTKVEYMKKTPTKTFVVVDTGMNTLIRPALYNAHHNVVVLDPLEDYTTVDIVGPLCESGDMLAKNRGINLPKIGSYILFENTGAYGYSMSNNYNSFPRPAEVLINSAKREWTLIRRREEIEDLFRTVT
ncbi:MAG TPA: diaminopimelate decarboxylase [Fervidobacterium sp.]|nr:diaminopimelate decarboxylase [Fervidobacterium sp.]HOM73526.1 diaminopimelate decarboxylase [Fervidobacterium sp.]HOQ38849.1 diaminopimelate decarboxylase [Fervidobacterium sp.]HPP17414.1 diaminopimelate decarboxylase [Fervidobacterium sp.]HPT54159.1 diaminopimelate decarboxylase [Fervidobacterium sp.]